MNLVAVIGRLLRYGGPMLGLVACWALASRSVPALEHPAVAGALDLLVFLVGMPLVSCALRVRQAADLTALPATIALSGMLGKTVLPAPIAAAIDASAVLDAIRLVAVDGAAIIAAAIFLFALTRRAAGPEARIVRALGTALPIPPEAAAMVGKELLLFYYALFAWRAKPEVPDGAAGFSMHRKSTDPLILWLLFGVSLVEMAVLHVIVRHWSSTTAWILSDLGLLGALFILGTLRAMQLRPALVTPTEIVLSMGLMASVRAPIGLVAGIARHAGSVAKARELFRTSLMQPANVMVNFAAPVRAETLYGGSRSITRIAAFLDAPEAFIAAVEARREMALEKELGK
jgi:hypothetical protein